MVHGYFLPKIALLQATYLASSPFVRRVLLLRLKRPVPQQNTVERDKADQDDENCYYEGDGPYMPLTGRPYVVQKIPVLPGCGR